MPRRVRGHEAIVPLRACGWFYTDIEGDELGFSYCPNCGARITGGGEHGNGLYIRRVAPREVHDLMHIAKRSAGWVSTTSRTRRTGTTSRLRTRPIRPPSIRSRTYAACWNRRRSLRTSTATSGSPCADNLRAFDELCAWMGGDGFGWSGNPPNPNYPGGRAALRIGLSRIVPRPGRILSTGRCFR